MKKRAATKRVKKLVVVDVLVVEDQEELRRTLSELLDAADFAVGWAANGAEALELVDAGVRPRLIVLDLQMPVMDGWEFLRMRKNHPVLRSVPVVIATGADVAPVVAEVEACLAKPVDVDQLIEVACRYGGSSVAPAAAARI